MTWDLWRPAEKTHLPHSPECASSLHCCEQTFQTQTCATQVVIRGCETWETRSLREFFSPAFIHFHGCYICLQYIEKVRVNIRSSKNRLCSESTKGCPDQTHEKQLKQHTFSEPSIRQEIRKAVRAKYGAGTNRTDMQKKGSFENGHLCSTV